MLMVAAFVVLLLTVPLAGGRLSSLGRLRLRWPGLLLVALAAQVLVTSVIPGTGPRGFHVGVHVGSYGLIVAFLLVNARVAGLWVVAVGMSANLAAIVANDGVMPATPAALERAGLDQADEEFENSTAVEDARLAFLGDIFAVPASWPLANVFSVGDVLIVFGGGLVAHLATDSRLARLLRRRQPSVVDLRDRPGDEVTDVGAGGGRDGAPTSTPASDPATPSDR